MAVRKKAVEPWTFGRKFSMWAADHRVSLSGFARRAGLPQSTLHAWVKQDVRVPPAGLRKVVTATRLPADWWLDEAAPYPPPVDYMSRAEDAEGILKTLTMEELSEVLPILGDPERRRRALAILRAAGV